MQLRGVLAKKRVIQAIGVFFLLFVGSTFFLKLYLATDWVDDGVLLWNSREAYLFTGWPRSGYHLSCFEYILAYIPAYFGVPRTYDDSRSSTIVTRITPNGIDRYVVERYLGDRGFRAYFPVGQTIYASDGGAELWKWSGTHFEKASPEEQQELPVNNASSQQDFQNVNGWSARHHLLSWPASSNIKLNDKPITFFIKLGDSSNELSLDLQLPGGAPQRILDMKRRLHLVSKKEYDRMFEKP